MVQRCRMFYNLVFISLMPIHRWLAHSDPQPMEQRNWVCPLVGSSMTQLCCPSTPSGEHLLTCVEVSLDFHFLCHDGKTNRHRSFAFGQLNFHGNLARLVGTHFLPKFSSSALLPSCSAWAKNLTAGSCTVAAQSLVME